eukprot:15574834-Heterocapsa_arctica.AAC.1
MAHEHNVPFHEIRPCQRLNRAWLRAADPPRPRPDRPTTGKPCVRSRTRSSRPGKFVTSARA